MHFCTSLILAALLLSAASASSLPRSLAINSQFLVNAACERAALRLHACQLANMKNLGPEGVQSSCCQPFNDLATLNCFCDGASKAGAHAALTQDAATIIQVSCDVSSVPLTCPEASQGIPIQQKQPCPKLFTPLAQTLPQTLAKPAFPTARLQAAAGNFLVDAAGFKSLPASFFGAADVPQDVSQPQAVQVVQPQAVQFPQSIPQGKPKIPVRVSPQQLQNAISQQQQAVSHQLTTARSMAGSSVTDALAFLVGAAKEATTLELDLDVDLDRPAAGKRYPIGTLVVGEQDGVIDAELDLEFDASEEDAQKLLEVVSELMAGRASMQSLSAMLGSGDEVIRGVVALLQTAGDRIQDLVTHNAPGLQLDMSLDTSSVIGGQPASRSSPLSSLKSALSMPQTTVLCNTDSGNPEACVIARRDQQQLTEQSARPQASILAVTDLALQFAVVIALVGFLCASVCAIVAHAQKRWQRQGYSSRHEDDMVPAGAIIIAANQKTPFLVHDGINYTPLPTCSKDVL